MSWALSGWPLKLPQPSLSTSPSSCPQSQFSPKNFSLEAAFLPWVQQGGWIL